MKRRRLTNEPARWSTLLALLPLLPALRNRGIGRLVPDLYGSEYNQTVHISPTFGAGVVPPTFTCATNERADLAKAIAHISRQMDQQ
jgi:hypothetical protein